MKRAIKIALRATTLLALGAAGVHCAVLAGLDNDYQLGQSDGGVDATIDASDDGGQGNEDAGSDAPNYPAPFFVFRVNPNIGDGGYSDSSTQMQVAYPLSDSGTHDIDCLRKEPFALFPYSNEGPYFVEQILNRSFAPSEPGPPGSAKITYFELTPSPDGGFLVPALYLANETTNCSDRPATRIDDAVLTFGGDAGNHPFHFFPRFDLNGSRVAYLDFDQPIEGAHILELVVVPTENRDAGNQVLRVSDLNGASFLGVPPGWFPQDGNTQVAWAQATDGGLSINYYRVDDPFHQVASFFACTNTILHGLDQFDLFVREGSAHAMLAAEPMQHVTLADGGTTTSPSGVLSIYVANWNTSCETSPLTPITTDVAGGLSHDLTISPDGMFVAFASNRLPDGGVGTKQHIWIADSLGGAPPRPCSALDDHDELGPQWFGGGKALTWTDRGNLQDGGFGGIAIVDFTADDGGVCGSPRAIAKDENNTTYVAGANLGIERGAPHVCSYRMGSAKPNAAFLALFGFFMGLIILRRSRDEN